MKVYHLEINVIRYSEERYFSGVYGTYEKALEVGIKMLERAIKSIFYDLKNVIDIEKISLEELLSKIDVYDYTFEITEIEDLEYAENFDIHLYPDEEYLRQNIKPTHIVNELNYKGEVKGKLIEYRKKNTNIRLARFYMKPEDFQEGAGTKFKIGDIVKVKRNNYRTIEQLHEDEKNWSFFSNTLRKKKTGLPVNVFIENKIFSENIKDHMPKIRVQNNNEDRVCEDGFCLTIKQCPKIVIGKCKLSNGDYNKVCEFIKNNEQLLIKCWNEEIDFDELVEKLKF